MMNRWLSPLALCASLTASAQQVPPARFELGGVHLGDSLTQWGTMYLCGDGSVSGETICMMLDQRVGKAVVSIDYSYIDGRLYDVALLYEPNAFDDLGRALAAKYGDPVVRVEPFAAASGARANNSIISWQFSDGTLELRGNGLGSISSAAGRLEYARRKDKAIREAGQRNLPAKPRTPATEATTSEGTPTVGENPVYFEFQVEKQAIQAPWTPNPRYPEEMKRDQVDGEVLAQFVVDTLGRAELSTFKVLKSTDESFGRAVRDALPIMRFLPAEIKGRKVRQLVQVPFAFAIAR